MFLFETWDISIALSYLVTSSKAFGCCRNIREAPKTLATKGASRKGAAIRSTNRRGQLKGARSESSWQLHKICRNMVMVWKNPPRKIQKDVNQKNISVFITFILDKNSSNSFVEFLFLLFVGDRVMFRSAPLDFFEQLALLIASVGHVSFESRLLCSFGSPVSFFVFVGSTLFCSKLSFEELA